MMGTRPNKLLGQHFLVSRAVLATIVAATDLSTRDTVLEIGSGTGTLTRALAHRAGRVIAVEKDTRLADQLREALADEETNNVEVIHGDILKTELSDLGLRDSGFKVVANIPYYLTSRLVRTLLEGNPRPSEMLLMVQREVAERMTAKPPRMNLLALSVQAYGAPQIVTTVPAAAFQPRPRVDSALIKITGISERFFTEHGISPLALFRIAKSGFGKKRKLLLNSLAELLGSKTVVRETLHRAGLPEKVRPEELSLAEWAALTKHIRENPTEYLRP